MKNTKKSVNATKQKNSLQKVQYHERCLICLDLDGTLLNRYSFIEPYTKEVIKRLSDMGHVVCLCSARSETNTINYYKYLGLKTPLVNYSGCCIKNPNDPEFTPLYFFIKTEVLRYILFDKIINPAIANAIFDTPKGLYFLYDYRQLVTDQLVKDALNRFNINTKKINFIDGNFDKLKNGTFCTILILKNISKAQEIADKIKELCSSVKVQIWNNECFGSLIVLTNNFSNKGIAVRYLSTFYDIPLKRCYAFGDNHNDLEMLSTVENGFAMKNAIESVDKVAKYVTKYTNTDQGAAYELNRIFKLNVPNDFHLDVYNNDIKNQNNVKNEKAKSKKQK